MSRPPWPDLDLRHTDPDEYARQYRAAFMDRPGPDPDPTDALSERDLDRMLGAWSDPSRPLSRHTQLAIAVAHLRGRPVEPNKPIPGCDCERCTGRPAPKPRPRPKRDLRPAIDVDRARSVSILDVARRLDLGELRRVGTEYVVRCPLHEDSRPSLRLDPRRNLWYCDPCGEGGDGIRLVMRTTGADFLAACKELAA